jgi:threonine synthase
VYVPEDVSGSKLMAIQRTGARPVRVEGDREAVTAACVEAVEGGEGFYASHAWHPAFLSGTKTFALEVVAQRDWTAPDAVVVPTGHGTLLLGAYRGFSELAEAGLIEAVPAMYAAQATGYAPVADAFEGDESPSDPGVAAVDRSGLAGDVGLGGGAEDETANEVADAIHIRDPARMDEIVEAVWATGGDALALGEDPVELHLDELHRAGFYVEPTCAAGPAALERLRADGEIDADDDVVVPLTGTGLKTL